MTCIAKVKRRTGVINLPPWTTSYRVVNETEKIHMYTYTHIHIDAYHRAFVGLNVADLFIRPSGFRNSVFTISDCLLCYYSMRVFIFENDKFTRLYLWINKIIVNFYWSWIIYLLNENCIKFENTGISTSFFLLASWDHYFISKFNEHMSFSIHLSFSTSLTKINIYYYYLH